MSTLVKSALRKGLTAGREIPPASSKGFSPQPWKCHHKICISCQYALNSINFTIPKGPRLTTELRVACVVLRFQGGMQHTAIAEELKLKPSIVRNTCSRVQEAAGSTELLELLKHCGTRPRSGRPPQPSTAKRRSRKEKKRQSAVQSNVEASVDSSPTTSSDAAPNDQSQVNNSEQATYVPAGDMAALACHLQDSNNGHGVPVDARNSVWSQPQA